MFLSPKKKLGVHPADSFGWMPAILHLLPAGLAVLLFVWAAPAQEEKHSEPAVSCVSAKCHAPILKHKYLHGPLAVDKCTVCHDLVPGDQHKFVLVETEAKLCQTCHKRMDRIGSNLHDPVAKGKCLGCHDPHGSEEKSHVRKSPAAKLCNECHSKKPVLTRKFPHTPAGRGECLACHRPHGTKAKKLLDVTGRDLCLQKCHEKMRPVMVAGREQKLHLAGEDCTRCHRSHDSNLPALLAAQPSELCLAGCHKEIKENIELSEFKHGAMTKGMSCAECHRAHSSKLAGLLRKPPGELCFTCHAELQTQIDSAKFKHRPAADKSCRSCHVPHGSQYAKLLVADLPPDSSSGYDPARYAFCFSCHEEEIVRERYVDQATGFRNGRLNLHYLHINKKKNGRTCRTCHAAHAGDQAKDIHSETLFRNWRMPVQYTKTETGGRCLSGCHKEYGYDRANPAQLKAQ
jgi:predicted CXXCH cytochrome family protein